MDHIIYITDYLNSSIKVKSKILENKSTLNLISNAANIILEAYKNGNKLLIAGNGGSAADAQHIAAEFVSRFFYDRPGLPALALTTDTSMLTAIGNDYGFDMLFERQVQAQGKMGDVLIGISTSGNSKNIINAVKKAKSMGITTISFCGERGELREISDLSIEVPSSCTPYIQESHICIGHMICAIVEKTIYPKA